MAESSVALAVMGKQRAQTGQVTSASSDDKLAQLFSFINEAEDAAVLQTHLTTVADSIKSFAVLGRRKT